MDTIAQNLDPQLVNQVLAGSPIDFQRLTDQQKQNLSVAALHCIINGPVSVHKSTKYPIVGDTSVDLILGYRTTNGTWRATCTPLATVIKNDNRFSDIVRKCPAQAIFGNLWPLSTTRIDKPP
jgi:hypothetical protein